MDAWGAIGWWEPPRSRIGCSEPDGQGDFVEEPEKICVVGVTVLRTVVTI